MAPKGRGAVWEAVVREAARDVDPRWTVTGRGARTVLTWGRVGWVWQHVTVNLKSGDLHHLYASRSWVNGPFTGTVDVLAQDLIPGPSSDDAFVLEAEGAVEQLRRWADLVPDKVFGNTLEQDLEQREWYFDLFLSEGARLPWMPLAGLRVLFGRDPRPVIDAAVDVASGPAGSDRKGREDPSLAYWREFGARVETGREATLRWLDELRRTTLRAAKVPDDLVEPVLGQLQGPG